MTASIHCTGLNYTDCTITFAINGIRWEYWLASEYVLRNIWLVSQRSAGKALALAKRRAIKAEKEKAYV